MHEELLIFIVDDDPIYCTMTKMVLVSMNIGSTVQTYGTGLDAKEAIDEIIALRRKIPDFIFLDLNMPLMDGWEFLAYLADQPAMDTSVYVVSSTIMRSEIEDVKTYKYVKDFIPKPIVPEKIQALFVS